MAFSSFFSPSQSPRGLPIQQEDHIPMRPKDAGLHLGGDLAADCVAHGLRLVRAGGDEQDLPGVHDAADAQADGLARHVRLRLEEALVRLDGGGGQVHHVAAVDELAGRLVETDVAVAADAEDLHVDAARLADGIVVGAGGGGQVGGVAVGNVGGAGADVHMAEELLLHEAVVAAGVVGRDADVLIEVEADGP